MPAITPAPVAAEPAALPANPNADASSSAPLVDPSTHGSSLTPDLQPAPAVIDDSSHMEIHVLPRRFLGPMPQSIATSDAMQEKRKRLRALRRKGMTKLLGRERGAAGVVNRDLERGLVSDDEDEDRRRRHRFRIRRRDKLDVAHELDFDVNESDSDTSSSSSEEEAAGWFGGGNAAKDAKAKKKDKKGKKKDKKDRDKKDKKVKKAGKKDKKKKKKKKKDKQFRVWVGGDGFDIGREFKTTTGTAEADPAIAGNPDISPALDDKLDVLADEIDAMAEENNTEVLRDDLWGSVGIPESASFVTTPASAVSAAALGDGETTPKAQERAATNDDASFFTARTKPPVQRDAPDAQSSQAAASSISSVADSFTTAHSGDVETPAGSFDPLADTPSPPRPLNPAFAVGLQRPMNSRTSTVETFRTARDHGAHRVEASIPRNDSHDSFFAASHLTTAVHPAPSPMYGSEATSSPPRGRTGSMRPLLGASDDEGAATITGKRDPNTLRRVRSSISSISGSSLRAFPQRLKSAMRVPSAAPSSPELPKLQKTVTWTPQDDDEGGQGKGKGKLKSLNTAISPILGAGALKPSPSTRKTPTRASLKPADPIDVLRRSGDEIQGTSTEAQEDSAVIDQDDFMPGGVVMRDRILVKVGRHRTEDLGVFDEAFQRRDPCYRFDQMEEYLVGMTMTSADFYVDWTFQCQESWTGHKRIRYSVPLSPPTRISVFNQRDMMLCLMCPWNVVTRATERHHALSRRSKVNGKAAWTKVKHSRPIEGLGFERGGLGIFLLKFGERTRALDWHWYIRGQLDYTLPKQIDIRIPALAQTIRMAIPEEAASSAVNTETTLKTLWGTVIANSSHGELMRDLGTLPRIELAWKGPDATLDWVAYSTTVTGRNREWALLASFAQSLQSGKRATLQARAAQHRALRVTLEDRTTMEEPVGIEGYLIWHRGGTGPKELVYASSNEGVVFVAPAAAGLPPLLPKREGSTPADLFPDVHRSFQTAEQRRMTNFIEKCTGCIDLRDIVEVTLRKESDTAALPASPASPNADTSKHISAHKVVPKQGDKKEREFSVRFRNGHTVTFEAHTPAIAAEWVERMGQLVKYWGLYHRVSARQDMDVAHLHAKTLSSTDSHSEELLNRVWNWCVIDGCRAVTMCGGLFVKRGKYRKFKSVYMVVSGGSLVTFRIMGATGLLPRRHVWPLFGSYIYSGMLAQDELRETVNEMAFTPSARMYADGLRSTDGAEDTTFCVRITWPTGTFAAPQPWDKASDGESGDEDAASFVPPRLSQAPSQLLICRARSRLERDRWVWAINAEKERCTRAHVRSEEKLRNTGNLPRFSSLMHMDGTADSRPAFRWRNSTRSSLSST